LVPNYRHGPAHMAFAQLTVCGRPLRMGVARFGCCNSLLYSSRPARHSLSAPRFRVGPAFGDDLVAEIDALVADVHAAVVGCDEHFGLLSALSAERACEIGFRSWVYTHAISLACALDQAYGRAAQLGRQSAPSNLIGANGFAGQDHCSRVCGAEHRRAEGAPLTVILNGKRIVGTVGRVTRTDRLSAVPETA
jgi:hypothetical protein